MPVLVDLMVLVPPRCRSEAQATLLVADTAVSSGGRSVQAGRGGKPSRSGDEGTSSSGAADVGEHIGRRKQGSLR